MAYTIKMTDSPASVCKSRSISGWRRQPYIAVTSRTFVSFGFLFCFSLVCFLSHHTRVEFGTTNQFLPTTKHPGQDPTCRILQFQILPLLFFMIVCAWSIQCELWGKRVVNSSKGPKPCVFLIYTPHSDRFRFSSFSKLAKCPLNKLLSARMISLGA